VTALHNDFVGVRHAGFTALQESLWERSQTRAKARADPAASAAFNRSLLAHLVQQGGRLAPGWLPGEWRTWASGWLVGRAPPVLTQPTHTTAYRRDAREPLCQGCQAAGGASSSSHRHRRGGSSSSSAGIASNQASRGMRGCSGLWSCSTHALQPCADPPPCCLTHCRSWSCCSNFTQRCVAWLKGSA
jgi:hypothetical protein